MRSGVAGTWDAGTIGGGLSSNTGSGARGEYVSTTDSSSLIFSLDQSGLLQSPSLYCNLSLPLGLTIFAVLIWATSYWICMYSSFTCLAEMNCLSKYNALLYLFLQFVIYSLLYLRSR